jgi:hypothetical protein
MMFGFLGELMIPDRSALFIAVDLLYYLLKCLYALSSSGSRFELFAGKESLYTKIRGKTSCAAGKNGGFALPWCLLNDGRNGPLLPLYFSSFRMALIFKSPRLR